MSKISELPAAGPLTGTETMPLVQDGTAKQAPFADVLASIGTEADTQIARVAAAGATQIGLAAAEADRAATQRALTEAAAITAQTAALSVGAPPAVSPSKASAFFGQESADMLATQAFLTLPAGALALPKAGTDWWLGLHFRTGGMQKTSQTEILLSRGAPGATGGADRGVWIRDRNLASGPLTMDWLMKSSSTSMMPNPAPTPAAMAPLEPFAHYHLFIAQIASKAYLAITPVNPPVDGPIDTAIRTFSGDANFGLSSFWFGAKATGTYTMVRTANVITVTRTSGGHGQVVGGSVYLSSDEGTANGVYVVTATTGLSFSVASVGANQTFTNPAYATQNTVGNLFNVIGASETGTGTPTNVSGFSGGVADLVFRFGTTQVQGALAASFLVGGALDTAVLQNIANKRLSVLPGTDAYSHNLGDLTLPATGTNSTAAPTATGTVMRASPISQPEYIRLDPRPHEWPHATKAFARTGSIRLTGTTNIAARSVWATIYSDAALTAVVKAKHVCGYPARDGSIAIETAKVPISVGYWVKIESGDNPNVYVVSGPHDVGDVPGLVSQSTLNTLFGLGSGTSLAPISSATGQFSVLDIAGDLTDTAVGPFTNQAAWCRVSTRRVRYAGQVGNGIVGAANKLIALQQAALGGKVPLGFVNLCTSGHAADIYINDRKALRTSIGNLTAGVAAAGNWVPRAAPNFSTGRAVYTLAGSAKLYVSGALVATSDASGNWVGQGVTGTFNKDTGAYTVTTTFGGAAEIEATMHYNTQGGTETRKTETTLTAFGDEAQSGVTGHVLERLRAAKRWGGISYVVFSWENYRVSSLVGMSDADAAAHTAFIMTALRARISAVLGEDVPWIVMADPRTTGFSDASEQRARNFTRAWAKAQTGQTYYIPGAITATLDAPISGHYGPNIDGGQYLGEVMAHGIALIGGYAGAAADEIMPVSAVRIDAATVDLYFSRSASFPASQLVTGAGGEPQGVYLGPSADALIRIDATAAADEAHGEYLGGYTLSFPAGTTHVVRIHKDSGAIPSCYLNVNWGSPMADGTYSLTTLAAQAAVLDNTLFLNTGGFSAPTRPGIGVQPNPNSIYVA